MFQFNPKIYRWFDRIRDTQEPEQWLTSQHSKYIHKGDLVAIWASGEKAGINALGQIITDPSKAQLKVDQVKYWIDKANISKFQENKSVLVKYLKIIKETPLLEDECQNNPTLLGLQVFINPQGTNFSLQYEQWQKITELIEKSNQ
jgi:5-methylcytosine-specific restriction protein B